VGSAVVHVPHFLHVCSCVLPQLFITSYVNNYLEHKDQDKDLQCKDQDKDLHGKDMYVAALALGI